MDYCGDIWRLHCSSFSKCSNAEDPMQLLYSGAELTMAGCLSNKLSKSIHHKEDMDYAVA